MKDSQSNYYAVIPANVRYSSVPPNAKLLYGEITALANKEWFCWASNQYFADLYSVSKSTVSEWVSLLHKEWFIDVEITSDDRGTPTRKIRIGIRKKAVGYTGNPEGGYTEKAEHNNTSINNTINIEHCDKSPNQYLESIKFLKEIKDSVFESDLSIPDFATNFPEEWRKFLIYWTESWKTWKIRAESEKTFEIKRRFATWIGRKKEKFETQKPQRTQQSF